MATTHDPLADFSKSTLIFFGKKFILILSPSSGEVDTSLGFRCKHKTQVWLIPELLSPDTSDLLSFLGVLVGSKDGVEIHSVSHRGTGGSSDETETQVCHVQSVTLSLLGCFFAGCGIMENINLFGVIGKRGRASAMCRR